MNNFNFIEIVKDLSIVGNDIQTHQGKMLLLLFV